MGRASRYAHGQETERVNSMWSHAIDPVPAGPILVVEDEVPMQTRLCKVLATLGTSSDSVACAASIDEAGRLLARRMFALALIDIGLPDGSGIDFIRDLRKRDETLPILVITVWRSEHVIVHALQAGATGYLLKERDDLEIALSIRSAFRGGAPIDPFVAKHILELFGPAASARVSPDSRTRRAAPPAPLSPRETEILALVGKGLSNREIAELLGLSRLTVECHIKNIYKKLSVGSRTQAIFEARTQGWLP